MFHNGRQQINRFLPILIAFAIFVITTGLIPICTWSREKNLSVELYQETIAFAREKRMPGYTSFIINVHDIRHLDESSETILRLIDIFTKYDVRGDFYFTAPIVRLYESKHPEVIRRLKESNMTISYHVRPPHPTYFKFDQRLKELDDESLMDTLRAYETYQLDLKTSGLNRDKPGGFKYVTEIFGHPPVSLGTTGTIPRIRDAALKIYKEMGAKMFVKYHEGGTKLDQPFEWEHGLLIRPSDFSITRWARPGEEKNLFWWNRFHLGQPFKPPLDYLKRRLTTWKGKRPPFITVIIHENNFFRWGATPWSTFFYTDKQKREPRTPPYDLNAEDPSRPRSKEEQERIWKAYEEMVAYAATYLQVVTSEDIVSMAK